MKKIVYFVFIVLFGLTLCSCSPKQNNKILTVYLPDSNSWMVKSGLSEKFEKENNCKLRLVYFEAAANIVARMELEKNNPKADVLMGLSRTTFIKAKSMDILQSYTPKNADKIVGVNEISPSFYATGYDHGGLAIIYNKKKIGRTLHSFDDLLSLKRQLVFSDPRTSTTGQDFLLWTIATYGSDWSKFWNKLKPAILTVTKGWSSAYAKLQQGEADVMISYAADNAYNIYKYKKSKFEILVPATGGFSQIEGAAIVKKKNINSLAEKFIDFLLSDDFQSKVFTNNWMLPVTNVKLPPIAKYYVRADKELSISNEAIKNNLPNWLKTWTDIVTN
jgi:thiamine transport system substrate-binding protein